MPLAQADDPRYEKGDMVWALSEHGLRLSGVVIGYHADRDLYWVVYTDDIAGRTPSVVQEWRLSSRLAKRETAQEAAFDEPLGRCASGYDR